MRKIRGPSAVPDRGKDGGDPSIHLQSPSFDPVLPVIPDQNFGKCRWLGRGYLEVRNQHLDQGGRP